jgi:hypothetical protein
MKRRQTSMSSCFYEGYAKYHEIPGADFNELPTVELEGLADSLGEELYYMIETGVEMGSRKKNSERAFMEIKRVLRRRKETK